MVKLNVLHMYPDLLNLYGDGGNMEILKYRCAMRNIECQVDKCDIDQDMQDFSGYDMIYLGGGADLEQNIVSSALMKSKDGIRRAYENGAFLLMICGGYQLMGQFYRTPTARKHRAWGCSPTIPRHPPTNPPAASATSSLMPIWAAGRHASSASRTTAA